MATKTIEQVTTVETVNGADKLLIVKTDCSNKTRSVTVDNFIHDNSINTGEINDCAVNSDKIDDGAIINRHITANTINGNIVSTGTLDADKICSNSITTNQISTDGICADCITAGTIDASQVTVTNINADNITSGNICGDLITGLTISADDITGLTITADDITTGTLDASNVTVTNLDASNITTGTLDASNANITNLNAGNITTGTLDAGRIAADSIDACKICACSITADQIDANAITACKIASGAIASSTQIVEGVLLACHISSESVITNTIQSSNFNGQLDGGEYTVGTQGYLLNASTGTLILNSLVARNNIIAGNYICYNEEGGFAVDDDGNFKVAVDDDTLTVTNGSLNIKTIPETAVVVAASDINYTGAHDVVDMGRYEIAGSTGHFVLGGYADDSWSTGTSTTSGTFPFLVVPLLASDDGPLNAGVDQIEDVDLYNITFIVDYSNVGNLASATSLVFQLLAKYSDIATGYQNTPSQFSGRTFTNVTNPVLPAGEVEYTIPSSNIQVNNINSTNEYLIVYPQLALRGDFTGFITLSAKASLDSRLIMEATGSISNPNRNFTSIISGAQ